MRLLYILVFIRCIAVSQQQENSGFCEASRECSNQSNNVMNRRLLFYDVNPLEGFNLRRDVYMRFAILLHEAQKHGKRKNWFLVLPPFQNLIHWRSSIADNDPLPWSTFFDVSCLKTFAPVLDLHEVFIQEPKIDIDVLYMFQGFDDPFENGIFEDKWQIVNNCKYDGNLWGFKNITVKEVVCVKFQGLIGKLWEVLSLHPSAKKVMVTHGEIPLHSNYGSKTYWDCRKSMNFNKELVEIAQKYISKNFDCETVKCNNYVSVHWRRQDFAQSRSRDVPSLEGTVKQLDKIIKKELKNITNIFIATDAFTYEIDGLESKLNVLGYEVYLYTPTELELANFKDGGVAIIEQIICSHAAYFIGTHESTFTFRIQEEREIMGFETNTTFNRLCPDSGFCEKPSKWTVVN
ncbi:GDP-fucose protein O-fucosyltransferase 2 [Plodia interpunctella]|uniref:GDP-fucose protein O-fucosyltransferase 2 n=1 Tax=Plodia interpunctella TaxID=58824 RepID=UPI002367F5BF|nr:GDP-fucose protein O-fucosyltransferase 2 [Plodia interpunctella]